MEELRTYLDNKVKVNYYLTDNFLFLGCCGVFWDTLEMVNTHKKISGIYYDVYKPSEGTIVSFTEKPNDGFREGSDYIEKTYRKKSN